MLQRYPEIALVPADRERAPFNLSASGSLAYLEKPDGQVQEVVGDTERLPWRVRNLNYLVDSYQGMARVERTSADRRERVAHLHPGFSGLIVYRQFRIEEVVVAAARGWLLPGGLTRFVISPRPLRVNYRSGG